ncbi:MAG: YfjI family protein [Planctomycetota bacterium]
MNELLRAADVARELSDASAPAPWSAGKQPEPLTERFLPFPIKALPAPIDRFVRAVAEATGTDPSWAALAALAVIAGCVGNRAALILKHGWVEPSVLWAALVGKSGSTKSVVLRLVTSPLVELFKRERDTFAEKVREYTAESERYSVAMSKWKSAQRTGPPTDPPVQPQEPRQKRILVSDVTIEKLAALLGENPLGLLVVRDELAGLVNSFNRYAGGKGSDLQSWLSMNDSGPLLVDRKSDGSTFVERASVSLLGTIQPFTLKHVFGSVEREAGLLARVLLAYPPDRPAVWTESQLPDDMVADWRELLAALQALVPALDDAGRPGPRLIVMASDAKAMFISWHDRHASEVADLSDDHLRAHWSKLKGVCPRIALLFSCTEAASGNNVSAISSDSIRRAIEVTEWLKAESARIYAGLGESDGDQDRRRLVEWIEGRGGTVTVRDLTHGVWAFREDVLAAHRALDGLVRLGVGRWVYPRPGTKGGQPAERFELTRRVTSPSPKPGLAMP